MKKLLSTSTIALTLIAFSSGCATKKFVRGEVNTSTAPTNERVDELESRLESSQSEISNTNRRVDEQGRAIDEQGKAIGDASKTAQDALDRALAAGKLAEGSLISETVFNNDKVRFKINTAELTDDSKVALDEFAAPLISANTGLFIEIQGHTDSSGPEAFNFTLGQKRAEAVRRHLNQAQGFPLHRMSVISYGESAPAYDNATVDGRRANRRVVLVVLK